VPRHPTEVRLNHTSRPALITCPSPITCHTQWTKPTNKSLYHWLQVRSSWMATVTQLRCHQASSDCNVSATLSSCKYGPADVSTPGGRTAVDGLLPHNTQQSNYSYWHPIHQQHSASPYLQFTKAIQTILMWPHASCKIFAASQDMAISTAGDVYQSDLPNKSSVMLAHTMTRANLTNDSSLC